MKEAKRKIRRLNLSLGMILFIGGFLHGQDSNPHTLSNNSNFIQKKFDFRLAKDIISFPPSLGYKLKEFSLRVPNSYSFEHLALFCRLEETVAKNSNVNMRFRLGSLEYVDQLERKPYTQSNYLSKK